MPLTEANPDAIAKVYAKSLFELAVEAGGNAQAETTLGELEDLLEIARGDSTFNEFLATRVIPRESRDRSLVAIFEGKVSDLTLRFVRLLNRKGRLGHLPGITTALETLVQDAFGRTEVDLFTAEAVDEQTKETFRSTLAAKLGKEIILHTYVEPAMLGGVKLRIGDRLVDDSLLTQLSRMRDRLNSDGTSEVRSKADGIIEN